MKNLVKKVVEWGRERGLDKVGHLAQAKYTLKETAELLDAYADQDIAKINDAIGDIFVTLIVGASNDNEILDSVEYYLIEDGCGFEDPSTYAEITFDKSYIHLLKDEFLLMKEFVCDSDYNGCIYCLDEILAIINHQFKQSLSLKDCLQLAYDEIKDRTGKMVNGQFIKDGK